MSAPYNFTPRGPLVPHSTPLSATVHGFSKPKALRAPIINPFDTFPQNDFDAWIGGLTNALRSALGEEVPPQVPSATQQRSVEGNAAPTFDAPDDEYDEAPDDSFADLKARRAKGKARDPREGPGLGGAGSDRAQPIAVDFSDEEEDEVAEGLTFVHDEESEEEQDGEEDDGEEDYEEDEEEDDGEYEQEYAWDRGQSSSHIIPQRSVKIGPPGRRQRRDEYSEDERPDEDDEEIGEGDYEEEYEDEESVEEEAITPAKAKGPTVSEVIDILDSDEEAQDTHHAASSPPRGDVDEQDELDEDEDEGGDDGRYAEAYDEDKENHLYNPPRRSLLADFRARHYAQHNQYDAEEDEGAGQYEEDAEIDEDGNDIYEDDAEEDEQFQPLEDDTSFPPHQPASELYRPSQINDVWEGPRIVAQDFYAGGDFPTRERHTDAHHISPLDGGDIEEIDDAEVLEEETAFKYEHQQEERALRVDNRYDDLYEGIQPSDGDTAGFHPHSTVHVSAPDDSSVELPDVWAGPKTYAEDYYAEGDALLVHPPEPQIDPSLLGLEGRYEREGDTASGIDSFLTPQAFSPNESDLRSSVDEGDFTPHDPIVDDQTLQETQWNALWNAPQSRQFHEETTDSIHQLLKRGAIPEDAEIIALDDSDEEVEEPGADGGSDEGQGKEQDDTPADVVRAGESPLNDDDTYVDPQPQGERPIGVSERLAESEEPSFDNANDDSPVPVPVIDNVHSPELEPVRDWSLNVPPATGLTVEDISKRDDPLYVPHLVFAPSNPVPVSIPESRKPEEEDLDDIYGSPLPVTESSTVVPAQHVDQDHVQTAAEGSMNTNGGLMSMDEDVDPSEQPDDATQPATAKVVSEHLSHLSRSFSELPTPPWEKEQPDHPEAESASVVDSTHPASISAEPSSNEAKLPAQSDIDDSQDSSLPEPGHDEDVDAEGEVDNDVEVMSVPEGSHGGDGDGYVVEEPITEGRLTEEPSEPDISIDIDSIYSGRSPTPVGLRQAVKEMGEPTKPEIIRPPHTAFSRQPSVSGTVPEGSSTIGMSPNHLVIPMPITADADAPDPTDKPDTPSRLRSFMLNISGTEKYVISPAISPQFAGSGIPVSVAMPSALLQKLREDSVEPGPSTSLPVPSAISLKKLDGLFTPAEVTTSTATPVELEEDPGRKQALEQIAEAIYEVIPEGDFEEWPGFELPGEVSPTLDQPDQGGLDVENAHPQPEDSDVQLDVQQAAAGLTSSPSAMTDPLVNGTNNEVASAAPQPDFLELGPSVVMHFPIARKPTDPILAADPYPYSLSTPGLAVPDTDEGDSEDAGGNISVSSQESVEKDGEDERSLSITKDPTFAHESHFDFSAPPAIFDAQPDVVAAFQLDPAPNDVSSEPQLEISSEESRFPEFQDILEAEDDFQLIDAESTVAVGEKDPGSIVDALHEHTISEVPDDTVDQEPSLTPELNGTDTISEIGSSQHGAKRKRGSSPDATHTTRKKGRRGRGKGKAKEQEPIPEPKEEEMIRVRPRPNLTLQHTQALSGSARALRKSRRHLSPASSVVSSAPSDRSSEAQPSPTTNKPPGVTDRAHIHREGLLFHAHGRRKNPYQSAAPSLGRRPNLDRSNSQKSSAIQNDGGRSQSQQPSLPQPSSSSSPPQMDAAPSQATPPVGRQEAAKDTNGTLKQEESTNISTTADREGRGHSSVASSKNESIVNPGPVRDPNFEVKMVSPASSVPPASPLHAHFMSQPSSSTRSTRSQCKFHRITLPREEDGPRICFIVPGCSLTNLELMDEEEIEDDGQATSNDGERMLDRIETLDFDLHLIGIIRRLVGVDILRENAVYYLPKEGEVPPRHQQPSPRKSRRSQGTPASANLSTRPPVSTAESTSTSLSAQRRLVESEEKESIMTLTESEPESSDNENKVPGNRNKPLEDSAQGGTPDQNVALRSKRGRPRKIKAQDMAYKPGVDEDDSPEEGFSRRSRKRGVKRTRTTEAVGAEERKAKKLRSHKSAPGGLTPSKDEVASP